MTFLFSGCRHDFPPVERAMPGGCETCLRCGVGVGCWCRCLKAGCRLEVVRRGCGMAPFRGLLVCTRGLGGEVVMADHCLDSFCLGCPVARRVLGGDTRRLRLQFCLYHLHHRFDARTYPSLSGPVRLRRHLRPSPLLHYPPLAHVALLTSFLPSSTGPPLDCSVCRCFRGSHPILPALDFALELASCKVQKRRDLLPRNHFVSLSRESSKAQLCGLAQAMSLSRRHV